MTQQRPLHDWRLVDAPSGAETAGGDILNEALLRDHATLSYGERCFEFIYVAKEGDVCFLRLVEVGRLTKTGSGRSILVFARNGYHVEQRVAPCRDALDAEVLRDLDPEALRALGSAMLEETALGLDSEELSP